MLILNRIGKHFLSLNEAVLFDLYEQIKEKIRDERTQLDPPSLYINCQKLKVYIMTDSE